MIRNYLIVSSVIFHILILLSLFWIIPFFNHAAEMGVENIENFQSPEIGMIEDVSTITREGVAYNGYKIDLAGVALYVAGTGDATYRIGD